MNATTAPVVMQRRGANLSVGVWLLIGVGGSLFGLFLLAYALRMLEADWTPLALPGQLRLSTALLVLASLALQGAARHAQRGQWLAAGRRYTAGGACALAFMACQWWAWQVLAAGHVGVSTSPMASFFYLFTAVHGLHVLGGLLAWAMAWPLLAMAPESASRRTAAASQLRLCARYWHFLLLVWLLMYAALSWLTPEVVQFICGRG
jgi:cytochrome c oxidase subunit 3